MHRIQRKRINRRVRVRHLPAPRTVDIAKVRGASAALQNYWLLSALACIISGSTAPVVQ